GAYMPHLAPPQACAHLRLSSRRRVLRPLMAASLALPRMLVASRHVDCPQIMYKDEFFGAMLAAPRAIRG
ncbi:MAG: hypothetical protein ACRDID_03795, partial [Ktedonobacterales bacterium]